jgi:hypothetical protein
VADGAKHRLEHVRDIAEAAGVGLRHPSAGRPEPARRLPRALEPEMGFAQLGWSGWTASSWLVP